MKRLFSAIRDAWLILGISLGLFFALEGGYRLWMTVAAATKVQWRDDPRHPYYGQAWYADLRTAIDRQLEFDFDPYRGYWAKPMSSPYLNIDSAGRRLTIPSPAAPGSREVLLLGGSVMWGTAARDSFTIPSRLAAVLARRGITGVRIVNLSQRGFNTMQELATLELALAHGARPAAVVLLNGGNDANAAVLTGKVGGTTAEEVGNNLIAMGKRGFWQEVFGAGRHSALVNRLLRLRRAPPRHRPRPDDVCPRAAAFYASVELDVLGVARAHGFPALIFLHPSHTTTRKRLSPWEAHMPRDMGIATCLTDFAAAMQPEAGRTFFDLSALFDADTVTDFVDTQSHTTEDAGGHIAEAIADRLIPLLRHAPAN